MLAADHEATASRWWCQGGMNGCHPERMRGVAPCDVHKPGLGQIDPLGIHGFNHRNFLHSRPAFNLFLPTYCVRGIGRGLVVYQPIHVISSGESGKPPCPVLPYSTAQVTSHAHVQDATRTRQNVDEHDDNLRGVP